MVNGEMMVTIHKDCDIINMFTNTSLETLETFKGLGVLMFLCSSLNFSTIGQFTEYGRRVKSVNFKHGVVLMFNEVEYLKVPVNSCKFYYLQFRC